MSAKLTRVQPEKPPLELSFWNEAKILNRYIICSDVNDEALERTRNFLDFEVENDAWQKVVKRDARDLSRANNESIDFILTHPPYADIIKCGEGKLDNKATGFWVKKSQENNFLLIMHEHLFIF